MQLRPPKLEELVALANRVGAKSDDLDAQALVANVLHYAQVADVYTPIRELVARGGWGELLADLAHVASEDGRPALAGAFRAAFPVLVEHERDALPFKYRGEP